MDQSQRLGLPLLSAGQSQKEMWVNEALLLVDLVVGGLLDGEERHDPPSAPQRGCFYRVAEGATGAWAGQDGMLAAMTAGGWRFVPPADGLRLADSQGRGDWCRSGGAWQLGMVRGVAVEIGGEQVVGSRLPAIADPAGGSVVDVEARAGLVALLATLRTHGLIAPN